MAYDAQNYRAEGSSFAYPPVPNTYTDQYTTSDTNNNSDPSAPALEPSFYPYYSHPTTAPATTSSHLSPSPDYGRDAPTLSRYSPAPFSGYETPPSPAFTDHALSPADATNKSFISYSATRMKRPRGTTGRVVCDRCGYRFTVVSSLNRHSKICRGRKSAKKQGEEHLQSSASTQYELTDSKNASSTPDNSIDALPTSKMQSFSSEEKNQDLDLDAKINAAAVADAPGTEAKGLVLHPSKPIKSSSTQDANRR